MLPKLRIRNPDLAKNTKMEIRRATTIAEVADSVPIFSGAFSKDYLDSTILVNGRYVYLVSLGNDTDGMVPQIPFWYNYRDEWGPYDVNLGVQQAVNHCAPAARGNMVLGLMFDPTGFTMPTYGVVTNWATLVSTGTGLTSAEVKAMVTTGTFFNVTYKGRIVRFPYNTENQAQLTTTAMTADKAAKALNELTTRLNDPSNLTNIYTVGGYKYALRVMDRAMYEDIKSSLMMNIGYSVSGPRAIGYVFTNMYIAKNDTTLVKLSNDGALTEAEVTTGSVTVSPLVYFEYIGPA